MSQTTQLIFLSTQSQSAVEDDGASCEGERAEISHEENAGSSVAMATVATAIEGKKSDHVTALTNHISVSEGLEDTNPLSVSSLLTQPEGEREREGREEGGRNSIHVVLHFSLQILWKQPPPNRRYVCVTVCLHAYFLSCAYC